MDIDDDDFGVGRGRIEVKVEEVTSFARNIRFEIAPDDRAARMIELRAQTGFGSGQPLTNT